MTIATQQHVGVRAQNFQLEQARVGRVRLAVSSLARSVDFYSKVIGFTLLAQTDVEARLGVRDAGGNETTLLELEAIASPAATSGQPRLGLFHNAFLLPSRTDLAAFVAHLSRLGVRFGAGDHIYSEAIYLHDPDGLGVEVYADRPTSEWPVAERKLSAGETVLEYAADTVALQFNTLSRVAEGAWQGAPADTRVGHVHLSVDNLRNGAAFYHAALGLDIVTWSYPGALFLSAGGYHHNIGMNTWNQGAPIATVNEPKLIGFSLHVSEPSRVVQAIARAGFPQLTQANAPAFADPWGTRLTLEDAK